MTQNPVSGPNINIIEKAINKGTARRFEGDKIFLLIRYKNNDPILASERVISLPIVGIHASDRENRSRESFVMFP